jgi:hypothetical protein
MMILKHQISNKQGLQQVLLTFINLIVNSKINMKLTFHRIYDRDKYRQLDIISIILLVFIFQFKDTK